MAIADQRELYHVVCRECVVESVFGSYEAADEFVERHVDETAHPVAVARVD